jgi:hypothetical protein
VLEIIIVLLQGKLGGVFFIPKKWRKGYYNYYKTFNDVKILNNDIESSYCSICLNLFEDVDKKTNEKRNSLSTSVKDMVDLNNLNIQPLNFSISQSEDNKNQIVKISENNCKNKLRSIFVRSNKSNESIKLMVTPCNHVFHPECLKVWTDRKNECPVCRKKIPSIED